MQWCNSMGRVPIGAIARSLTLKAAHVMIALECSMHQWEAMKALSMKIHQHWALWPPWSPPSSALTNNFKPPHIDHAPSLSNNGVSQRSCHWWTAQLEMLAGLRAMLDLNKLAANFHGGLAYHLPGKATTYDHNRQVGTWSPSCQNQVK